MRARSPRPAFPRLAGLVLAALIIPLLASSGAFAADSPSTTPGGPDLTAIRAEFKAKQYQPALAQLKVLVVNNQIPDVFSLLGFALRKTGDRPQAMVYYNKALAMNPDHRGALEYQGELFVEIGQIDNAKANLAKLKKICPFGCEEQEDLEEAIEHGGKGS